MTLAGREVLLVGQSFHGAQSLTERLNGLGFRCRIATSMRSASNLLTAHSIHLVLSNTILPDGTGFSLLEILAGLPVTAFLCLPVENSCLWLPAIDEGKACLGMPALRPAEFSSALADMAQRLAEAALIN
jgi:CheY-like chemotaxis protein